MLTARTYWWRGRPNFGDALAPLLLKRFGGVDAEWAGTGDADLFSIGSVLESARNAVVLGSGKLYPETQPSLTNRYLAVRGPLTGVRTAFGDPGLLAEELVTVPRRIHQLGILPHWSDNDLARDPRFTRYNHVIIDPGDDPLVVVKTIGSCHKIVTSSLHGAIVADSFGIPRRIEVAPRMGAGNEGGMFKFRDYNTSVGVQHTVGKTQSAGKQEVETLKHVLYDLYQSLEGVLDEHLQAPQTPS